MFEELLLAEQISGLAVGDSLGVARMVAIDDLEAGGRALELGGQLEDVRVQLLPEEGIGPLDVLLASVGVQRKELHVGRVGRALGGELKVVGKGVARGRHVPEASHARVLLAVRELDLRRRLSLVIVVAQYCVPGHAQVGVAEVQVVPRAGPPTV